MNGDLNTARWPSLGDVVTTRDGSLSLLHPEHGECYHSDAGAAAEALNLYLRASGIEERFASKAKTAVLDVGLGLGYNALATLHAWQLADDAGPLELVSLEINPELVTAMASGQAPWQSNWDAKARAWMSGLTEIAVDREWRGEIRHRNGHLAQWRIVIGDAATAALLTTDSRPFDYVWQDPFSPDKNPSLWTSDWFAKVRASSSSDCVLMTYSVARRVRDALAASNWSTERIPTTLLRKRHWLKAKATQAAR